jgi:hypothetical protein
LIVVLKQGKKKRERNNSIWVENELIRMDGSGFGTGKINTF